MWINIQNKMYNTDHFAVVWEDKKPNMAFAERFTPTLTHVVTSWGEELIFYQPGILEEVTQHGRQS